MAEKKLFTLDTTTLNTTLRVAVGKSGIPSKNATLADLRSWIVGEGGLAKQTVLEIGPWDMVDDSFGDPSVSINVVDTVGNPVLLSNIRGLSSAIIFTNNEDGAWEFLSDVEGTTSTTPVAFLELSGGYASVALFVRIGGFFQTASVFEGTSNNRGYVVVNHA